MTKRRRRLTVSTMEIVACPAFDRKTQAHVAALLKNPVDVFGRIIGAKHFRGVPRVLRARDPKNCRYPENMRSEV